MDGHNLYKVSLAYGFNLPMMVVPVGVPAGNCSSTGCLEDLNIMCPSEVRVKENGQVVVYENPFSVFSFEKQIFCCIRDLNPDKSKPSADAQIFKKACPKAFDFLY
ncbi:Thaumatin protein [Spatholobus suberectus]|nr:Thaumatin protein [Spatholobus suberectus]